MPPPPPPPRGINNAASTAAQLAAPTHHHPQAGRPLRNPLPPPPPPTQPCSPWLSPPRTGQTQPQTARTDPTNNFAGLRNLGFTINEQGIWQPPPTPAVPIPRAAVQIPALNPFQAQANLLKLNQAGSAAAAAKAAAKLPPLTQRDRQAYQASLAAQQQLAKAHLAALTNVLVSQALAPTTKITGGSAQRRFLGYLKTYGVLIDRRKGIDTPDLANYITYLWNDPNINSSDTISQYISNGVRRWHLDNNIPWVPMLDRPLASAAMAGARRDMTETGKKKKLPITVHILQQIHATLDLSQPKMRAWWTAALVAFYCMMRKSNVCQMPPATLAKRRQNSLNDHAEKAAIRRGNVRWNQATQTYTLRLLHTKTIQDGARELLLHLSPATLADGMPDVLCPVNAMTQYLQATSSRPANEPLFGFYTNTSCWMPMDYDIFTAIFKDKLRDIGINPSAYAGHSFRRGGATFAFAHAGLSTTAIKAMGDWASNAFLLYCEVQERERVLASRAMSATAAARGLAETNVAAAAATRNAPVQPPLEQPRGKRKRKQQQPDIPPRLRGLLTLPPPSS